MSMMVVNIFQELSRNNNETQSMNKAQAFNASTYLRWGLHKGSGCSPRSQSRREGDAAIRPLPRMPTPKWNEIQ